MCGVIGLWENSSELRMHVKGMALALSHRGPDDHGIWEANATRLALAHRRLSILDLSPLGHQPMHSASQRYTITFNGEIYNFRALAEELSACGHRFRGRSDTEILLAAFEEWGVPATLPRLVGMFAFGVWDSTARVLSLARDRLGEKPLFYGWNSGMFLFASELKALRAHPLFQAHVDRHALAGLIRYGYVPCPQSIYTGVYKLPPACLLEIPVGALESYPSNFSPSAEEATNRSLQPRRYWCLSSVAAAGLQSPFRGSADEASEELEHLLSNSVRLQMVADVPVGAFLSGGIDSSTVTALMQNSSSDPIRTFSIGFHENHFDEASHARAVAEHLKTQHTELYVTPDAALAVIPKLPDLYDEPFGDSSQIPTFLVSQLAREHVVVSLSGDGGDELFGGYERYRWTKRLWGLLGFLPQKSRQALDKILQIPSPHSWQKLYELMAPLLPRALRVSKFGTKMSRLGGVLGAQSLTEMYARVLAHHHDLARLIPGISTQEPFRFEVPPAPRELDAISQMMFLDTLTYLPDDILTKVDRAAMGVSLESRVPLLDHRLVEFAWRLPPAIKLHGGLDKSPLRRVLYRHVPEALFQRPKMGFGVPVGQWLTTSLRPWAEALLNSERLRDEGFFDPSLVQQYWHQHISGQRNYEYLLWHILMFQAWWERHRP